MPRFAPGKATAHYQLFTTHWRRYGAPVSPTWLQGSRCTGAKDYMAYAVYRVVSGPLHNKTILAYQGSSCDAHLVQVRAGLGQALNPHRCLVINSETVTQRAVILPAPYSLRTVLCGPQDFKQMLGRFKSVADKAEAVYEDVGPDFITGHSLGGCIAEVVCSRCACCGAA